MLRFFATTTRQSFSRRARFVSQTAVSRNMNTDKNNSVKSPPHSPPAKRVKTDGTTSTTSTMAHVNGSTIPTTTIEQAPPLLIKKLSDKARLPTRGSAFAAGYDIYAAKATVIPARGKAIVDTDISMAVPAGTYGRIAPRSGLAAKNSLTTGAGVIDADYRGQVKVLLFNLGDDDFAVSEGDRIAQLVLERIYTPEVLEVAELEESVRGAGGFGSTGGFGTAATAPASNGATDGASDAPSAAAAAAAAAAAVPAAAERPSS